jgi:hypothetical protein
VLPEGNSGRREEGGRIEGSRLSRLGEAIIAAIEVKNPIELAGAIVQVRCLRGAQHGLTQRSGGGGGRRGGQSLYHLARKQKAQDWLYSIDKGDNLFQGNEYTDSHTDATPSRHYARTIA